MSCFASRPFVGFQTVFFSICLYSVRPNWVTRVLQRINQITASVFSWFKNYRFPLFEFSGFFSWLTLMLTSNARNESVKRTRYKVLRTRRISVITGAFWFLFRIPGSLFKTKKPGEGSDSVNSCRGSTVTGKEINLKLSPSEYYRYIAQSCSRAFLPADSWKQDGKCLMRLPHVSWRKIDSTYIFFYRIPINGTAWLSWMWLRLANFPAIGPSSSTPKKFGM